MAQVAKSTKLANGTGSRRGSLTGAIDSNFDPKTFFVAQSLCRLVSFDRLGSEREGFGFLAVIRLPLRATRYGIITTSSLFVDSDGRSFNDAGAQPTIHIDAHFDAHTHAHKVGLVVKRDITKWFASQRADLIFLQFREEVEALKRKSYNFLAVTNEIPTENQQLMIFRKEPSTRAMRCSTGKFIENRDFYVTWDHSIPNLVAGTPLITSDTFKVVAVHQADPEIASSDNCNFDHAISMRQFLEEMEARQFLDEIQPVKFKRPSFPSTKKSQRNQTGNQHHLAFGNLIKGVANFKNAVTPNSHGNDRDLQLSLIRDATTIEESLKDGICSILTKHGVPVKQLAMKSDDDLKKLFHRRDYVLALNSWKKHIENSIKEKLESDSSKLHKAVICGDVTTVKLMLRNGKLLPRTSRQWLVEHRDSSNHGNTPLLQAAVCGHLDIVEFLVKECRADVFAKDLHSLESTSAHLAAAHGHVDVLAFLLDSNKALVEAQNAEGDMPLNRAAARGRLQCVEFLVEQKNAAIDHCGELGRTPLLAASAWGHLGVVNYLAKKGVNIYSKDSDSGSTCAHLATYFGHVGLVDYFLDKHPQLFTIRNRNGKTPLARAKDQKKLNVVRLIESRGVRA